MARIDHMFDTAELTEPTDLSGLVDATRGAAHADVAAASDQELCDAAIELERARASLDAAQVHVLAELDLRGVCDRDYGLSTASWLAHQTHASRPHLAARLKVGASLRSLTEVDAALCTGDLTFEHARALAGAANPRIADQLADCQDQLIDLARQAPFAIWCRDLRLLVDLLDQDGSFDPERELARNHLHLDALTGDHLILSGELVGETALTITHAIQTEADRLWRQYRHDHELGATTTIPRRPTLLALALASLCRQGHATNPHTTRPPENDITLIIDTRDLITGHHPSKADLALPAGPASPAAPRLTTTDGQPLELAHYAHLFCDTAFHALILNSLGLPLDLGRTVRLATPHQRRALTVRDGGCVFPGCNSRASWCDIHHVVEWQNGGGTDLAGLALLCRHHHGVTHRRGWHMGTAPEQTFTWTTPTGHTLTSQRHLGRRPNQDLIYAA
jgi:hypothetical protein